VSTTLKLEKTKTPGIFKRGNRYVVVYRDPGGRQRKAFAKTLAEARGVKASLATDVRRGEYRELSRVTLGEYAAEWIVTYTGRTSRGVGEGTRDDYRGALDREIIPALGRLRLAEIEARDIKRLAAALAARGLAPASVSKSLAPLKALLATALEDGLVRSNASAGIRIAQATTESQDDGQAKALTEDELEQLLAKTSDPWRFFFGFLFESGLRIGEAIELRWGDIEGDWVHVDRRFYRGKVGLPKGRKKRRIRLSQPMARALWTRRNELRPAADELVFTSARGQRVDPSNLGARVLKPAGLAAGVGDWIHFHTLRHTCATALFRRGWNAVQVQRYLGHSDAGFTLRTYVHLLDEDLPQPDFGGNARATEQAETGRDEPGELAAVSGL